MRRTTCKRTREWRGTRTRRGFVAAALASTLLIGCVQTAAAQASPWLTRDHWTRAAVVRLHALGLTPRGFDPAARVHTFAETRDALAGCAEVPPHAVHVPAGCAERFTAERSGSAIALLEAAAVYDIREGAVLGGGFSADREWTGPEPLDGTNRAAARVRIGAIPHRRVALSAAFDAGGDGVHVEQANAEVRLGPVAVWGGRRVVGFSPGAGGGLVLNGAVPVDGGGVRIADAVELRWVGAVTAELFIGKADSSGFVARPWLLGMRVHAQPHPRFDIGATRAAVFGGIGDARVGIRQVAEVLVAANPQGDHADDQVASIDGRWRPPIGGIPLEIYGEWALHDIDLEVLLDMPALTVGARVPAIPGVEAVGIALEHTRIGGSCCGNPPWYHHFELANGWSDSGVLRGHPLGGEGREWRVSMEAALIGWRLLLRADAMTRTRGSENLFAPDRAGRAHGGSLSLNGMISQHAGVELHLAYETAEEWQETRAALALRWHP